VRQRVVIVGGGFGGLYAARVLGRVAVDVTLIDRRNFHLFQPLLYQVATGGLSPGDIAAPLRSVLKRHDNTTVLLAEVVDFDLDGHRVILRDGAVPYDVLIVSAGAQHHYFGHDEWATHAPGLKTIEDATALRTRILGAFEAAEREVDVARREAWLTFVIVGGGPTGVELAGAIGELARQTMDREFRNYEPASSRILLVEAGERVLPTYPPALSAAAERALRHLGVEVRTRVMLAGLAPEGVTLRSGEIVEHRRAATVLWAAGVTASPLALALAERAALRLDREGRIPTAADCSLPGRPEVFVIGDMARFEASPGRPLPGVAPVAMQQGRFVAGIIRDRIRGVETRSFRYRNRGSLAVIGRAAAVADFGRVRLTGYVAWLLWLFVHILYLVEFENRLLVFVQWAYCYFTRKRGARLITAYSTERSSWK
jgi:NADH dehydrogenase